MKILEGEMLFRTQSITLMLIFCETNLNFKVNVQSIKDPDNNFNSNFKH